MPADPPANPLGEPTSGRVGELTAAERAEVERVRIALSWYRDDRAYDDVRWLLHLVDRLTGDPLAQPNYVVEHGSSIYMCGHGSYQVREAGRAGTLVDLTAGPLQAWRLRNLLNGRSRDDPPFPTYEEGT